MTWSLWLEWNTLWPTGLDVAHMTLLEPTPTTWTESSKKKVSKHRSGQEETEEEMGSGEANHKSSPQDLNQMDPFSHVGVVTHMTLMNCR